MTPNSIFLFLRKACIRELALESLQCGVLNLFLSCRVWRVRYNHFHDQLVLSSSSDSRVILNNIISLSSEPFGHLDDDDEDDEENKEQKE